MRNQRAGQATFIPLDTIQAKPINDKFRSFAKGARLAIDVIHFDPVVERAIHHACGNALVCDVVRPSASAALQSVQDARETRLLHCVPCLPPLGVPVYAVRFRTAPHIGFPAADSSVP